jgi:bleomycin hydrolase
MFTVYWEYVEKARRFIRERGNSHFAEGSEGNAVTRIWKQYGCVPEDAYTGLKSGQKFHAHDKLIAEMTAYLNSLKTSNAWNEEEALTTIKAILNFYLGVPPEKVTVDGKTMTPLEYMRNYLKIVPDDYIEFMSMLAYPFYTYAELEVEDNWWKSKDYCNIPIDDFMTIVKNAVKKGYTLAIGGDVSEPGYDFRSQCAIVPTFDIPSEYIDDNARQMRFDNKTTTDDHGVHIVGWLEKDGVMWFLVKDSGSGSRNGTSKGYYFYHEDYIKLKMLSFTIHRSAVEDVLKKMK